MNKKYYNCFSYNLKNYLEQLGFKAIDKKEHHTTKRTFWVYPMTETLSVALKAWSFNK